MAVVSKEEQAARARGFASGVIRVLGSLVVAIPLLGDLVVAGTFFKHFGMILHRSAQRAADLLRLTLYIAAFFSLYAVFGFSQGDVASWGFSGGSLYLFVVAPLRVLIVNVWFSDIDSRLAVSNEEVADALEGVGEAARRYLKR